MMTTKIVALLNQDFFTLGFISYSSEQIRTTPVSGRAEEFAKAVQGLPGDIEVLPEMLGEMVCSVEDAAGQVGHTEPLWSVVRWLRARSLQAYLVRPDLREALLLLCNLPDTASRKEALSYLLSATPEEAAETTTIFHDMQALLSAR